jgi:hypothetical protein
VPQSFYDVVLLGRDLAGLIAATLCARRGLRVLVVDDGAADGGSYSFGPYRLPRAPQVFAGESSPAVRRVVGELNFIQLVKRKIAPHKPAFQVVLPDARVEVSPDPDVLARELARELPDERAALDGFIARAAEVSRVLEPVLGQDVTFPPDGFWEKREIARNDSRLPAPGEDLLPGVAPGARARALVALPAAFSLPCDPRAMTPTAVARVFDVWRRGTARFDGGEEALRGLLVEKLRTQHAGEVRALRPGGVLTKWGRAAGLVVAGRDEVIGCAHILGALPAAELIEIFAADKAPKRLAALARGLSPTAYRFVLNVVLSGAGVAEGISPVTLAVFDPARALIGDNAVAIHVAEPDDDGRVVVTLQANAAPEDGEPLEAALAALRPRLLERLEEVMPFSAEHILTTHSPHLPEGDLQPTPPEPLWSSALPAALGVGALPYDVGVKAVTPASAQNLVGLGLEGAFAAGWSAARVVSTAAGKKRDYLGELSADG